MFYDDDERHDPEVHEWCYRLMHDPEYFEQWRYIDTLYDYSTIIAEMQKLYDKTPATQQYTRARIQSEMKEANRDLAKTMAEYDRFKEFKERTRISK